MNRFKDLALTVGSFVVMTLLFQLWFQDWITTIILMGAIALHELGHILALAKYGLKTKLLFIPFLGAATIPIDQEALKRMKWYHSAVTYLSGPWANFLLILAFSFLGAISQNPEIDRYALIGISLNASLGVLNLWPINGLDGDGFARNLFESLPEVQERGYVRAIRVAVIAIVPILLLMGKIPSFFTILIPIWIIGEASKRDKPINAQSHLAMNRGQALIVTAWYITMLVGMILASTLTPSWTTLSGIAIWPFFLIAGLAIIGQLLYNKYVRRQRGN